MLDQDTQASAANAENLPAEFSFEGHAVRTIPDGEWILLLAKDVAAILGYENTRKAISDHCKNAKSLQDLWGGGVTNRYAPAG
jgi:prophage antirepressor-like protein